MATKTYIILSSDGRHVAFGRATEPSDAELDAAAQALRNLGLGGWLCVMYGRYYTGPKVSISVVRTLAEDDENYDEAVRLFFRRHYAVTVP